MTNNVLEYAKALFELSNERNQLAEVTESFEMLLPQLSDESMRFFLHPRIEKSEKKQLLSTILTQPLLLHFFYVLIDNERFTELKEIYTAFVELIHLQKQVIEAAVYSKTKLSDAELKSIQTSLTKKWGKQVLVEQKIDSTILSGFRIEIDGTIIDDTSNRQLEELKTKLKRG